jgi:hypothetical protein
MTWWDAIKTYYKVAITSIFPASSVFFWDVKGISANPTTNSQGQTSSSSDVNSNVGSKISVKALVLIGLAIVAALVLLKFFKIFNITALFKRR